MAKLRLTNRNKDKLDKNGKKKKPNWEWRFEIRINGERKNFSKSGFATKAEAEEAGTAALAEYNGGGLVKPKEMVVSDFLDIWVNEYVMLNLRHKTQLCYIGIINNHLKPNLGHYQLNALSSASIQTFINSLKEKGLSKRHTENILSTLKNALNYAIEPLQFIKINPAQFVKLPRFEKTAKKRIVIEQDNFETIISRFPECNKWHLPLMIGYHTGMRISEVFALTWNDIDLNNGIINVTKQTVRYKPDNAKTKWCLGDTKSTAGVRSFKIGVTLLELLKRENIRQKENRLLYGPYYVRYGLIEFKDKNKETLYEMVPGIGDINLICVNHDGSMITTDSFKYCSRVIHHELKLEFDFHSLRHTHATILAENGVNPKALQNRMGHEKIETTFKTYIHKTNLMEDESIELFERAIAHKK